MATYEYRCPDGSLFETSRPIGQAPDTLACPLCGEPSRRVFSAPHLSRAGSAAFRLIDSTKRSSSEPEIVDSRIPGRTRQDRPYTSNPLHRKLPRP